MASLIKRGDVDIIRPSWILDSTRQAESDKDRPRLRLPLEPRHMFYATEESNEITESNIDDYGDSFARDLDANELDDILKAMPKLEDPFDPQQFREQLEGHHFELRELPGWMFEGTVIYADSERPENQNGDISAHERHGQCNTHVIRMEQACRTARFAGASLTTDFEDRMLTHVLVNDDQAKIKALRKATST